MYSKKELLLFLFIFFSLTALVSFTLSDYYLARWVIVKGSSLRVDGSTNINKFSCVINNYSKPDTITALKSKSDNNIPLTGRLKLDVQSFDCHHAIMTKDLRKTLKATEFPTLHIRFINLNKLPDLSLPQEAVKGWVEIELAGVNKKFLVNYKFSADKNTIHLIGNQTIGFSDFKLTPPRKLGGAIQTNNNLNVEFHLILKNIN